MTSDKNRVQDILNRALTRYGGLPQRQVDAAMDRAWRALRPEASRGMTWTVAQSPVARRSPLRLAAAAAAALVVAAVGTAILWRSADNALFRVVQGDVQQRGEAIRSKGASGAVLALTDGSRVEMRSQSELSLERADDGVRIRLNKGSIIVNAAKQREGHLYVQTKDVTVSVVGTVFLVNAEEQGSRVAVLEGEVRVLRGTTEQKLLPGQQLVTSPLMMAPSLSEDVAWSRNAESHVALLQQASVVAPVRTPQNPSEPRIAFEEVSIRGRQGTGGGGGARGAGDGGSTGGPCESVAPVQLDPGRLAISRAGLLWLITAAYGVGPRGEEGNFDVRCRNAIAMKLLSEGPDWGKTTEFDIVALLPTGTPAYTERQVERGEAPEIQRMLQTMLAERFKLVLKREARDMPVYVLSAAPGGPRLTPAKERPATVERDGGVRPANPTSMSTGLSRFPDCARLRRLIEGGADDVDANRCRRFDYGADTVVGHIKGFRVSIDRVVAQLQRLTQRPVVNRTGITGAFDVDLLFAPTQPSLAPMVASHVDQGRTILSGPSLFKALEDQMGLRLEPAQVPVETFVIERVEKPTEN
jgi:uncharacterized protein (TIGR03435 family)